MPLYAGAQALILANLKVVASGGRAPVVAIGGFTESQLGDLKAVRRGLGLNEVADAEILFIGRHLYESRSADGYAVEDMLLQIESALAVESKIVANSKMTTIENPRPRADGYGAQVHDRAVFECTQRKPRAELYSVIPKGDLPGPKQKRTLPRTEEPFMDDPG